MSDTISILSKEEKTTYDNIVELEKLGGSAAFLHAIEAASLLVRFQFDPNAAPFGMPNSVPLTMLQIWSLSGLMQISAQTQDGYSCSGTGAGYISKNLVLKDAGTLHYVSWTMMLAASSFSAASPDVTGQITVLFTIGRVPAGVIRAPMDGGTLAGTGGCTWKHT